MKKTERERGKKSEGERDIEGNLRKCEYFIILILRRAGTAYIYIDWLEKRLRKRQNEEII